jgi:antibiotic biosynthesis monooxygenase (ABM) superfamily enzyme
VTAVLLDGPVTVSVTRRARPERAREVRAWLDAGTHLAEQFAGFLGAGWLQPAPGSDVWHVLYRFADGGSLAAWESSAERTWWLASADELVEHTQVERRSGIEGWFDMPAPQPTAPKAPPRWKQAVMIWSAFFPLSLLSTFLLAPLVGSWPLPLRVLVSTVCLTPVMVYVVLPQLTTRLHRWLTA